MTASLSCSLPVGDQVARRGNFFSRAVARGCLRLMGWRLDGAVPNLPKMILIGGPHTSNMDGVVAIAIDVTVIWAIMVHGGELKKRV